MRSPRGVLIGVAMIVGSAVLAGPALGVTSISGWGAIDADMGGGVLVWADAAPAKTRTFTYWRVDVGRARVFGARIGPVTRPVAVRTSAGPMTGASIRATGTARGLTVTASGSTFAGPVIWCCDAEDVEVVVSSDGRHDAPHPLAAGLDGARVRWIESAGSTAALGSADPVEDAPNTALATIPGRPGPGLASVARGIAAWADVGGGTLRIGVPSDAGVTGIREIAQGGRVLTVRAVPGMIATVVRTRSGHRVVRTDVASGKTSVVWTGRARPRIAVGGRAIAIGTGAGVLASRGGTAKAVGTARGTIAAVATDGSRVAVFERVRRRVKTGRRTASVRYTDARIIGRVR